MPMDPGRRDRLRRHLRIIDEAVAPIVSRYREHMDCRAGCSDCCHQTFLVSEIEGELLLEGLAALDAGTRDRIVERAHAHEPDREMACPALSGEGRCEIYEHRPRICRKYGIPLWTPERPHEVSTCPKNFQDMEDIDADLILEPQAAWAQDWIQTRGELGLGAQENRTIAAWIISGRPAGP